MQFRDLKTIRPQFLERDVFFHRIKDLSHIDAEKNNNLDIITTQLFTEALRNISDSLESRDDDLIKDSVLHLTNIFKDSFYIVNDFKNYELMNRVLNSAFDYFACFQQSLPFFEMLAYISSSQLFMKSEIMNNPNIFQCVIETANSHFSNESFIILSNYSLENESNARKVYSLISPQSIQYAYFNNFVDDFSKTCALSLISAYCYYDLDKNATSDVIECIKCCIDDVIQTNNLKENNLLIINELFYALSNFRRNSVHCIQKSFELGLFECFENLVADLPVPIIVTILQFYGDAIILDIPIRSLDVNKIMKYVLFGNDIISETSMWMIWTYLNADEMVVQQIDLSEFLEILRKIIPKCSSNQIKSCYLVFSFLVTHLDSNQIGFLTADFDIIPPIFDLLQTEDEQVVFNLIKLVDKLLSFANSTDRNDIKEYVIAKCSEIELCDLSSDYFQILRSDFAETLHHFAK